jgi:hypothetical protein
MDVTSRFHRMEHPAVVALGPQPASLQTPTAYRQGEYSMTRLHRPWSRPTAASFTDLTRATTTPKVTCCATVRPVSFSTPITLGGTILQRFGSMAVHIRLSPRTITTRSHPTAAIRMYVRRIALRQIQAIRRLTLLLRSVRI